MLAHRFLHIRNHRSVCQPIYYNYDVKKKKMLLHERSLTTALCRATCNSALSMLSSIRSPVAFTSLSTYSEYSRVATDPTKHETTLAWENKKLQLYQKQYHTINKQLIPLIFYILVNTKKSSQKKLVQLENLNCVNFYQLISQQIGSNNSLLYSNALHTFTNFSNEFMNIVCSTRASS